MSTIQSFLSAPSYGYDFVVAVTQASINTTMKEYLSVANQPVVTMYYNQDENGNPVVVDYATLMTQTNGTDPFSVQNWDASEPSTAGVTNIGQSNFWYGFKAQIGLPPGYAPQNIPDLVSLNPGTGAVSFTLLCSSFTVVEANFGRHGLTSFVNQSQQPGAAWLFTSTVPVNTLINNTKLPADVQQQLNNLGPNAFSVQQLMFDLDNAALETVPTLSGVAAGSAVATALNEAFVGAYCSALKGSALPVLGYTIVPNNPAANTSSLSVSKMNFEISPYVPANAGPEISDLNTLNYLCATGNDALPPAVPFTWNWVEQSEEDCYDGAIAINRKALANYFCQHLMNIAEVNCYVPSVHVALSGFLDTQCNWTWNLSRGQTPSISLPATGSTILDISYQSSKAYDQAGLNGDMGSAGLSSNYSMTVSATGNTIVISQTLVVWISLSSLSDNTEGNVVNRTITDTYTVTINENGGLMLSAPVSTVTNSPDDVSVSGFTSFFNGLNDLSATISNYANDVAATQLTDVPVSAIQNFVFPGGKTFTYASVGFSENQDLVAHITYTQPQ
ncbi:hypothetical protein [Mucilaginibacter lacusdianchii]|uniref:hypothetical protein n=1 Tax=Mucilaginibacter lacusdianchii TaxID=2684211 RepID=UPI00131EA22C|nr:hypothetical protein [Mucilaginibacter sp. JXJ CY 39]